MHDRGIKTGDRLAVLRYTNMPAILVELGFIDNDEDAKVLEEYLDLFAEAIGEGILRYVKERNKSIAII